MTINRPLRELTTEGLLKRVHGVGTFVAEPARHASLIELRSIADEIKTQGKQHRAEVLEVSTVGANKNLAERMQVDQGHTLFYIELVHYQDDVPIQIEQRYVNPDCAPEFLQADFTQTTPADYLIAQIRPDELEHIVQAILPDELICQHLLIESNEPCLRLKRRTWLNSAVVTSATMVYPSSRYDLGARYQPD